MIGYGSYNEYENAKYYPHYVALIHSGYTIIITHLRGGGDYGFKGYSEGRLLNKKNTFDDFIHIADYIVEHKITTCKKLAIWGRSAGGLLIATVLNMRPDICELAIIGVPFIKVYETLQTFKTPLGIESRDEFGNISNPEIKEYIKSYSPLDNINLELPYPNIFIYSNVYDTLVPYTQPLDYYNKIKEATIFKKGQREISIFIDNKFGHKQGSSVTNKIKSYSIIFDQLERYIS
jgi:oligopeptidase B